MKWIQKLRAARLRRISPWQVALADLPAGLESYWRASAPREYEGIRTDAFFFARAAEGLLRFFDAVQHSGRPCALPSEAADSVWHAWLRWNPVSLDRFCVRHFGAAVPHVERAALAGNALLHTFAACRARDGIAPRSMRLPALFALDAQLRMPGGHGYWSRAGEIVYARLNGIVERTVETQATKQLNLDTQLSGASVSLFGGNLKLNDLQIASPQGFAAPRMFTLGQADVSVKLGELRDLIICVANVFPAC